MPDHGDLQEPPAGPDGFWRLGLDLGSTAAKAVLLSPDGAIAATRLEASHRPPQETAAGLESTLRDEFGLDRLRVVATGYGRAQAAGAGRRVTEITCHARGVRHLHPDAGAILDIGGQDAKAIRLGPAGNVEDFAMNDRCAAGTGCFLEVAARRYALEVAELSAFCGGAEVGPATQPFEISSTCVVFAESELVGLNARGVSPVEALRAVHRAIARRVCLLVSQVGAACPIHFTGGVAQNETLRQAIEHYAGVPVVRASLPQFTGALGAALLAEG
ncbi:MAG: acyl-CoA dehydratase activase [Planctomycetes bacterium]|nr:acyl-CoA dehydratase activase [Planctomycetota bacterium]